MGHLILYILKWYSTTEVMLLGTQKTVPLFCKCNWFPSCSKKCPKKCPKSVPKSTLYILTYRFSDDWKSRLWCGAWGPKKLFHFFCKCHRLPSCHSWQSCVSFSKWFSVDCPSGSRLFIKGYWQLFGCTLICRQVR